MTELSGMDKYKFRRALEQIEEAVGRGTELVSVYIPPERPIFDVTNYLRAKLSQSSNIKSASTRKHVTQAIESAMQRLKSYKMPPPNGLVVFTGHKQIGADQTEMVAFVLEPPEPVTSFLYRCDSKFYTAPLHEMLAEKDLYGLVVIDWSEATLGLLRGKRIEVIKNLQSQVPSKHRMGGQSARRFERGHDIAVHEWYKKIGDLMTEAFLNQPGLRGIIIGGPGYSKEEFATGDYLHHELKKRVMPTFLDTGYTDEYGLRELVEKSREILSGLDLMREKALVQGLMEEIRKEDGGLAAYGEDQVRHALQLGAVQTLLISEGLRKSRLKLRCANGDWEGEKTVAEDGELPSCPKDGGPLTVVENRDLIEDVSGMAGQMGSNVELVSKDSEEGALLLKAFGGIAAILRYRVTYGSRPLVRPPGSGGDDPAIHRVEPERDDAGHPRGSAGGPRALRAGHARVGERTQIGAGGHRVPRRPRPGRGSLLAVEGGRPVRQLPGRAVRVRGPRPRVGPIAGRAVRRVPAPQGASPPGAHEHEPHGPDPCRAGEEPVPRRRPGADPASRRLPGAERVPGERHWPPDGPPLLGRPESADRRGGGRTPDRVPVRRAVPEGERQARDRRGPQAGDRAAHAALRGRRRPADEGHPEGRRGHPPRDPRDVAPRQRDVRFVLLGERLDPRRERPARDRTPDVAEPRGRWRTIHRPQRVRPRGRCGEVRLRPPGRHLALHDAGHRVPPEQEGALRRCNRCPRGRSQAHVSAAEGRVPAHGHRLGAGDDLLRVRDPAGRPDVDAQRSRRLPGRSSRGGARPRLRRGREAARRPLGGAEAGDRGDDRHRRGPVQHRPRPGGKGDPVPLGGRAQLRGELGAVPPIRARPSLQHPRDSRRTRPR